MSPFLIVVLVLLSTYKIWLPTAPEIDAPWPNRSAYLFCILLLAAWMGIYFPGVFSVSYMPDEAWFLFTAVTEHSSPGVIGSVRDYLFHPNNFGYGGTWWGVYTLIVDLVQHWMPPANAAAAQSFHMDDFALALYDTVAAGNGYLLVSLMVMRALAMSVVTIFALLLSRRALHQPYSALGVLLLFSMPMMYWSGKIASPELFGVFLLLIAIVKYVDGRDRRWFLLAGLACGTKLTCTPVAVVFAVFAILGDDRSQTWRRFFEIAAYSLIGTVLSSLYLVANPAGYVQILKQFSGMFPAAPWELSFKYGPLPFWEGGTYGNLAYWFGSLAVFGAAALVSLLANVWLGAAFICATAAMFAFMLTQPLHNWYWFPVVGAAAIPICYAKNQGRTGLARMIVPALMTAVVVANFYFSISEIRTELGYRKTKVAQLAAYDSIKKCLAETMSQSEIREFFDMAALGHVVVPPGDPKVINYRTSFGMLPEQKDLGTRSDRLAIIGPLAQGIPNIADFLKKAEAGAAVIEHCGATKLVRF